MPITVAADGYRLWYEAVGEAGAPAIVLPVRRRDEFGALAEALAERHRVVRYKPRRVVGEMEPDPEAGGGSAPWDPASLTETPVALEIADLHAVADAAGAEGFLLAGYSGMAALAGFLAPLSERVRGLLLGGFPLLSGWDYWLGFEEGARAALIQAGMPEAAAQHHLGRLLFREWAARDDRAALAALPGPKVLWYGSRDSTPDCRMYDYVGGGAIASRNRDDAGRLRELGFAVLEIPEQDHIGALAETALIAPQLLAALEKSPW
ncbi:alpha/beta fold hydrolase [Phaeacidiphilus oryzae]|uniref:alpha/beta fold hydrolase n=1 Tax=Phaeacidiphilus oryzae TaxID=348818 RepID=UPI000559D3E8|nr:hypothetical protein [Phaeacidiphilus oryzae]